MTAPQPISPIGTIKALIEQAAPPPGLSRERYRDHTREQRLLRWAAYGMLHHQRGRKIKQIAYWFNVDHTTVRHALRQFPQRLASGCPIAAWANKRINAYD